jgi:hypothetical protein
MAVGPDDPGQDHSKNQNRDEPVRPKDVPRSVGWPESQHMDVQNGAAHRTFKHNSEELQRRAAANNRDDGPTQEPDYDNDLGAILADRDKSRGNYAALKQEHAQSVGDGSPQSHEPDYDNDLGAILADRDKMRGQGKELEHEQGDDLDVGNDPSQEPDLDNDLNALMNLKDKSAHRDYGVLKREQDNTPDRDSDGDKDIGENELTFTSGKTGPELDRGR